MEIGLLRMKNANPEDSEGYGVGALMLPEVFVQKVNGPGSGPGPVPLWERCYRLSNLQSMFKTSHIVMVIPL